MKITSRGLAALAVATAIVLAPLPAVATSPESGAGTAGKDDDYLIGAYYFSGWYEEPNRHFSNPLINGGRDWRLDAPEREPAYGWYDDSQPVMDQQIIDASSNGLDYFVFDWFPDRPTLDDREGGMGQGGSYGLHNGLDLFRSSAENSAMQFSLIWANHAPFDISSLRTPGMTQAQFEAVRAAEWDTMTDAWVELFSDPRYLTIDNKPVISIFDVQSIQVDFSTGTRTNLNPHQLAAVPEERAVLAAAIDLLRLKAQQAGFDDILFGAGLTQPGADGEYVGAHDQPDGVYDFFSSYNWAPLKWTDQRDLSYHNMIRSHHDYVWDYYADNLDEQTDYIPVISAGWDNILRTDRERWVHQHTPLEFGSMLREAKSYLDEHPQQSLSGEGELRMAVIASWNELFEGHAIVPTKAEGDAWVSKVGEVFGADASPARRDARLDETIASAQAFRDAVGTASPGPRFQVTALLAQLRLLETSIGRDSAAPVRDAQVRLVSATLTAIDASIHRFPERWPAGADLRAAEVRAAWSAMVAELYGVRVGIAASDYSVVEGQDVAIDLTIESVGGGELPGVDATWSVVFPDAWQMTPVDITGTTAHAGFEVPAGTSGGLDYVLDSLLPTPSTLHGTLHDVEVEVEYTIAGVDYAATVPVQLTIVPAVDAKVVSVPFAGAENQAAVWLQNLSDAPLTGRLTLEQVDGVSDDLSDTTFTLQPRERKRVDLTVVNTLAEPQQLDLEFDTHERGVLGLEVLTVQPRQQIVTTSATLDASIRSTGVVELASPDRLQVGNAANAAGDIEYRVVVSIPLDAVNRDQVSTARLNLAQFQYIRPGQVVIEHLAPLAAITSGAYSAASSDAKVFAPGTPRTDTTTTAIQEIDVTDWVNAELAAGSTHLTVRLRMTEITPGVSSIRAYRPAEFTSSDPLDGALLRLW